MEFPQRKFMETIIYPLEDNLQASGGRFLRTRHAPLEPCPRAVLFLSPAG